jgi:endonuclease/exonuclease/phosphatase family metal-dependent hydrolase
MKILTLNTWGESGPWRERWDLIFGGLESYAPDIVAFQEVFNKGWGREIVKRAVFPFYFCPGAPGSGLILLSRSPIQSSELYTMKRKSPFEDYLRYALWAEIESEGRPLHIFTTHLSWMLDDGETRRAQAGELRDWMDEKAGPNDLVLTGDLNAPPDAAEIRWLVGASGLIDAFAALHPGEAGFSWDNGNPFAAGHRIPLPDRRIDYILARGDRMTRTLRACDLVFDRPDRSGLFASDHFGVMAEFDRSHG